MRKLLLLTITVFFLFSFLTTNGQTTTIPGIVATNPAVTINQSAAQADPTNLSPISFTVVFDQAVIGFTTGDVVISGTAGALVAVITGGPTLFYVGVSGMPSCGTVTVNIPAGVCTNALLQPNLASTSLDNTVTYLPLLPNPNVTINQAATQPDPASASPINFTVVFDQVVTGFATGDVTLSGTAGATTGIVTGSGTTYNVAVSGTTAIGTVIATIAAGVSQNGCTQPNNASTSTDNTVTINCVPPVVNVTPAVSCGGVQLPGGGPCNPLTASGNADMYIWSPLAGLYTNCILTVPYTGTNLSTVYAAPTSNTTYTVTGTIAATGCVKAATALVNYTPPLPIIIPASVNMCLGDPPVKLRVASGNGVAQFCSGTVNIAVPDNNPAGVFSSINVAGLSTICAIAEIKVRINMQHTRAGNMVFALKAPNGAVLNLDYHLSITGGTGSTTGFVNTVISSLGGSLLSAGTNPYTGTFSADVQGSPAGGFGASGPTGMLQTVTNWAGLVPIPASANGTWTLGFYDGVTGDVGTLTSWCLEINYSCPAVPASPAVWSPAAGLFANAAATIPYIPGTAVDSVWVRPTPAGVYTYQVTTSGIPPGTPVCTSPPRSVVVTVAQAVTIITQPANQTLCGGIVAVFSVGVTGTGPVTYQWQVSSNGGSTYTNINAISPYSGVNTGTLTVNPVTVAMNGYLYRVVINGGSGSCGAISAAALLTVGQAVTIATQPVNQTLCAGGAAAFTVGVTGTGPFAYQWQVSTNGGSVYTNIVNAGPYSGVNTATLTVNPATVAMNGYLFKVAINGGCSGATSSAALLTVSTLPTIVITANPLIIGPTQTTTIFSTVTPNAAAIYSWYYNTVLLPGATASSLLVNYGSPGDYRLQVTDVNGCTNLSNIITIANSFSFNLLTYPNPSAGRFQVRYNSPVNNTVQRSLMIYNNWGERIITNNFTQTIPYQKVDVDVRANGKGLYWVELRDGYGRRLALSRVVVQ